MSTERCCKLAAGKGMTRALISASCSIVRDTTRGDKRYDLTTILSSTIGRSVSRRSSAGEIPMSELVDSMQTLGFQDKNPMMFETVLKISAKRKGGNTTFVQFAEDLADHIVSDCELDGSKE